MIRFMISVFMVLSILSVVMAQENNNADIIFKGKGFVITKDDVEYKKKNLPQGFTTTEEEIRRVVLMNRLFSLEADKKWNNDSRFNTELEKEIEAFKASKYRRYLIDQIDVSDKVLESYFIANPDQFYVPEKYNFKIITTSSLSIADSIVKDIKENKDTFDNYAKKMSLDTASGERGGDVGWVDKDKLPPIFVEKLSGCPKNEVCGPFEFNGQWVIFYLMNKTEAVPGKFDDKVKRDIREKLLNNKTIGVIQSNFEKLTKEYSITSD